MLLIGITGWMVLAVFVCLLGRAAKAGDRFELERLRGLGERGRVRAWPPAAAPVARREESVHPELLDARRALQRAEARLAQLEGSRHVGAA